MVLRSLIFELIFELEMVVNKKSQSEQNSGVFFNLAWDQYRSRTAGYDTQARNQ